MTRIALMPLLLLAAMTFGTGAFSQQAERKHGAEVDWFTPSGSDAKRGTIDCFELPRDKCVGIATSMCRADGMSASLSQETELSETQIVYLFECIQPEKVTK